MQIKPLSDRVVVEPLEAEEKTSGGIYLPDTAKEKPQMGKIIATGPGKISDAGEKIAMQVKKGDKVLYGKYSGTEVQIEGKDYIIMHESDIFAII
jgi:chaperonin GroES